LALSYVHPLAEWQKAPTMSQNQFGQLLNHRTPDGSRWIDELVIYPPRDGLQVLTGRERLTFTMPDGSPAFSRFAMRVSYPFKPFNREPPTPTYSLRDYIDGKAVRKGNPPRKIPLSPYRYAWWAVPGLAPLLWMGGGLLLIGGVWPIVLSALISAGYGRVREEPGTDLSKVRSDTAPGEEPLVFAGASEEEAKATIAEAPAPAPPGPAPLSSEALATIAAAAAEEKHYAGSFYPTAAHADPVAETKKRDTKK
jgi:hypothetical protein